MHRSLLLCVVATVICLTGCRAPQSVKNAWKDTRGYYNTYLNKPAQLDMETKGVVQDYELVLAAAISEFDFALQELERVLQNSDRNPGPEWVESMSRRFPWLGGLVLADDSGIPRAKVPVEYSKPFTVGNLLEEDSKQHLKALRAFVQQDYSGPELYIGNPVYMGEEFRGVIIAHFDPRVLIARTADPGQFIITSTDGLIWPGLYDYDQTPLATVDWDDMIRRQSFGVVTNSSGSFYWVARYVGNLPLVYAVRVDGEFSSHPENLYALSEAQGNAIGAVNLAEMAASAPVSERMEDVGDIGSPDVSPDAPEGNLSPANTPEAMPLEED